MINTRSETGYVDVEELITIAEGFKQARIIQVCAALGVFELISEKPSSVEELAIKLSLNQGPLNEVLQATCSMGVTEWRGETVALNDRYAPFLKIESDLSLVNFLCWMGRQYQAWAKLDAVLAGHDLSNEWIKRVQPLERTWISCLHELSIHRGYAKNVASDVLIDNQGFFLDVGAGSGAYAIEFCRLNSKISAILFDRKNIIDISCKYIQQSGVGERITTQEGDFERDEFPENITTIFMSNIFHGKPPALVRHLCIKAYNSLSKTGTLILHGFYGEGGGDRTESVNLSITMLVNGGGKNYSLNELAQVATECGFKIDVLRSNDFNRRGDLIICRKYASR
jgi:SAM-dependent methyltransferase